ncbi:T9SS type A sorting domain-containing protein [Mucilaginibacter sp. UYCu711]|uniref:T9SS type A sorting domain-containing protein n=1 Tax=Mucilaginibacter sp. UYCu711 TaxID=3156339 RepID=UPI003D24C57A
MHSFYRLSVVFFCIFLSLKSFATVNVTPASQGTGISADKSAGSGAAAFTALGDIVITSGAAADFTTGTNVTLVLSAPANWQFQSGAGTATGAGNITITSTIVTGTTITVTYSAGANLIGNKITISGLSVQATAQTVLASANIFRSAASTGSITGVTGSTNFGSLSQVGGAYVKLQLLLPGETAAAATVSGKTGTPTTPIAGTAFNVIVNAVDANWNVTASTNTIAITASNGNVTLPANAALVAGTKSFAVTLKTAGAAQTITATDNTSTFTATSPAVTPTAGAFNKMQILLPGETAAPGTITGKTGTPTGQVAGIAFNVIVNAVDANWNLVASVTDVAHLASTDANAVLPADAALVAGTETVSVTLKTAASKTLTASDVTTPARTANTSAAVVVGTAAFAKLQILVPGETTSPGSGAGKTGAPTARTAGTAFTVIVNAVDAYWNKVITVTDIIHLVTTDANGVVPADIALANGTMTFTNKVNLKTPGTTTTITVTDVTDGTKTSNISPALTVNAGAFTKLQILLPGETAAPGTTLGKTGTPTGQVAGATLNVTVNAVDAVWNVITSTTDVVNLSSTDANAVLPANTSLVAGTTTLSVTVKTAGARTITATDVTNPAKTGSTSASVTVSAGAFIKLQLLVPGETAAAGTATGKTGTPTGASAGTAFAITVNAVDAYWNKVTSVVDFVQFTTTDANGVVPANTQLALGTKSFTTTTGPNLKTPGTQTITVADFTDGTKTADTSPSITVSIGTFTKLQLLLPGETAAPGTTTGKTGTPTAPVAGTSLTLTVNAVDAAWNVVTTATDVVNISSNDLNAALPANAALVSGTKTFSFTFKTATTTRTITATDVTNGAKTANTSPSMTVAAGAYSQLQLLLPGETAAPGTVNGKSGTASPPARGVAFNIIVNAVDANFNKVTSVVNTVTITSTDAGATLPAPTALVAGTKTLSVKIVSNATSPFPTITATDAAITTTISVPGTVTPTATTDYFRTKTSGNWNDASIWESSVNGTSGWQDATITPTSAANIVTILNTHAVTVTANVTADQIVVQTGAQIIVNSGITLTIASGGADVTGTITNAGVITPTGTLTFLSGGKYQHNTTTTNGTIPAATWNNLSTCEIIGYTSYAGTILGGNQTFGNFIWNCPGQNVAGSGVSLGGTASVNDLTVISTGTGNFQLATAGGTITVRGNYNQSGGTLVLNNASGTTNFNIAGNVSFSGGAIQKGSGSHLISFNGSATQTYLKTGGTFSSQAINFAINSGATVDFGTSVIDNTSTGTFTLNGAGTIITANDDGLALTGATGSIQSSGTRTYSTTGNYIYNDTGAQSIGTGLPLALNNLTISGPGATMPATSSTYTINGTLTLTGNLDMGTNILGPSATFANTGAGTLKTQATATPIPTGKTWNVAVEYNGAGSDQTIVSGTYINLSFSQAANKVFAAGTVTVTGNWSSSNGKINILTNAATVAFTGTAQLLDDNGTDAGNGVVFKNVTFGNSGTKTLNSGNYSVSSSGLLTMSGTAILNANDNLTLLADATGTGSIGPLTSGAITGRVAVQTFITGGGDLTYRGYRLLSSPVSDPSSGNAYYNLSYLKGSGSYLTGSGGSSGGFDVSGAATVYLYREDKLPSTSFTSGNYRAITAINNAPAYSLGTIDGNFNMPVGNGFLYFFRGNNGTNISTVPNDVVLNTSGIINQGQIVVKDWFNYSSNNLAYSTTSGTTTVEGFNLVGNPYPSSIDWNTAFAGTMSTGIYAPNTDQTIYIYNVSSKNYATYLNTSASAGAGTLGGSNIIPSGQGFFVHATNGSAQLVFNESAKVNAHPGTLLLNSAAPINNYQVRIQLSKDTINKDENIVIFNNNAHDTYALNEDALYLKGSGSVNLSNLSGDKKALAINQLPFPKKAQSIPLNVGFTTTGVYSLGFTALNNFPDVYDVWLMDAYKKDSLDVKHNPNYSFTANLADTNTYGSKRFSLVLRPNPALTVHLLSFTGTKTATQVKLAWKAENESSYTRYILERSINGGKKFNTLDSLTSANLGVYNDLDPNPVKGQNLYRLKQIDLTGNISYSSIVPIMYADNVVNNITANLISVYPNPVKSMLNLAITPATTTAATTAANYKITITNTTGSVIKSSTSSNPTWQGDVSVLSPGTYFIEVTNIIQNTLIGKSTFVKL